MLFRSYCTYEGGDDPAFDPAYPDPSDGGYKGQPVSGTIVCATILTSSPGSLDCGIVTLANVISISYSYDEWELSPAYMQRQCNEYAKVKFRLPSPFAVAYPPDSSV